MANIIAQPGLGTLACFIFSHTCTLGSVESSIFPTRVWLKANAGLGPQIQRNKHRTYVHVTGGGFDLIQVFIVQKPHGKSFDKKAQV